MEKTLLPSQNQYQKQRLPNWTEEFIFHHHHTSHPLILPTLTIPSKHLNMTSEIHKFNQIFDNSNDWKLEFERLEREHETIKRSENISQSHEKEKEQEKETEKETDDDISKSARALLESLDLSDSKLAKSNFVAYLKELSESDSTLNGTWDESKREHENGYDYDWKKEFLSSIDGAGLTDEPSDDQWRNLEKTWEKYSFSGMGYEGFAHKEFSQYTYSVEDAVNPFHGQSSQMIREQLTNGKDLKTVLLALEELTRLKPDDPTIWCELGQAQCDNEIDVQAIAAFSRSIQLDGTRSEAFIGLASACVNEFCIPDAISAFESILKNYNIPTVEGENKLSYLIGVFRNTLLIPDEGIRVKGLSVLLNMNNEHDEAIALLQNCSLKNDHVVWNRLGATLANSKRFDEAIKAYERALALNPSHVRALYNLGVSYMNMENYPKAIGFMIRALQSHLPAQTTSTVVGLDSIWNTMRIVGDMWDRDDLSVLIEEKNVPAIMNLLKEIM